MHDLGQQSVGATTSGAAPPHPGNLDAKARRARNFQTAKNSSGGKSFNSMKLALEMA
jgi:hypothetical protein